MTPAPHKPSAFAESYEEDEVLVRKCLEGDDQAWSALIRKYANLIFSIPIRRHFSQEDAADVFQGVCLALLGALGSLREPKAVAAWLIRTTVHMCNRQDARRQRFVEVKAAEVMPSSAAEWPDTSVDQLESEQLLREAVTKLGPECRKLVELLFFTDPPVPYELAAAELGLARGSMGATRMRCLEKLRRSLEEKGFG